jgi:aminocarboxymuconate-semialdehyde decarboxylase
VLDLHAHVVLEGVLGRAGVHGPELTDDPDCPTFRVGGYTLEGVRYRGSAFMDLDRRLEAMDALGITRSMLSPNPLTDRLWGSAQLPLQDPGAAAAELARAVGELGLVAAYVGTDAGHGAPVLLDDPAMDELWAAASELGVPVFLHPAPPGIDHPLTDQRVRRFDADLWLSFAFEETLAVATLVFGGVLDRHPDLRVCVSHGGGALVGVIGKLRQVAARRPWVPEALREPGALESRLRRLWYDAHVSDPWVLALLESVVGEDRTVGGTNLAGWDQPSRLPDPSAVARLDANAAALLGD